MNLFSLPEPDHIKPETATLMLERLREAGFDDEMLAEIAKDLDALAPKLEPSHG